MLDKSLVAAADLQMANEVDTSKKGVKVMKAPTRSASLYACGCATPTLLAFSCFSNLRFIIVNLFRI